MICRILYFNPRSSCEERLHASTRARQLRHFNPRSSCEERRNLIPFLWRCRISIHAPHARSDNDSGRASRMPRYFNPRSSCEERHYFSIYITDKPNFNPRSSCEERRCSRLSETAVPVFQSTLLMRGATITPFCAWPSTMNFNPRSSCEERRQYRLVNAPSNLISIHAPHARSDERDI